MQRVEVRNLVCLSKYSDFSSRIEGWVKILFFSEMLSIARKDIVLSIVKVFSKKGLKFHLCDNHQSLDIRFPFLHFIQLLS